MENLNPSIIFEVGYGKHLERIARGELNAQLQANTPRRPSLRTTVASGLAVVTARIDSAFNRNHPAEVAPV
jgi:hypothetical protein